MKRAFLSPGCFLPLLAVLTLLPGPCAPHSTTRLRQPRARSLVRDADVGDGVLLQLKQAPSYVHQQRFAGLFSWRRCRARRRVTGAAMPNRPAWL